MVNELPRTRRRVLAATVAGVAAAEFSPGLIGSAFAQSGKPILLGVPTCQTAAAGVAGDKDPWPGADRRADDNDHWQGTTLAMEEINAAGGILGRPLKLFKTDVDKLSPESCKQAIA